MIPSLLVLATAAAPSSPLSLGFDPRSGEWSRITVHGAQVVAETTVDVGLTCEAGALPPRSNWRLVRIETRAKVTAVTRQAGDWEIRTETRVSGQTVRRRATFRWGGTGTATVTGALLRTPAVRLSGSPRDWALVPGNFPIEKRYPADLPEGARLTEAGWTRGDYGVALLHSSGARLSVAGAYSFEHDQARVAVERIGQGIAIEHAFDTIARLEPGQSVTVGEQVLCFVDGDERALRSSVAQLSNALGNGPPRMQASNLADTVLYEVHPWGRLESWSRGDRGHRFDRLGRLMGYYRWLGANTLWLLPVSWPPPWVYTLPAFDRVAPENGTPEQLRTMIAQAHSGGIKVLADLVVYGIHPDSDEVKRLPDAVWCRDRNGDPVRVWGGTVLAADTSHPAWQSRIRQVADHWARGYGFDGARLDCIGWGQTPNWSSARPNAAIAEGGLALNKVVRDAFRAANPRSLLLPEGGKPLVFRNSDMVFDYPLYLAMREITQTPELAGWVSQLQAWLDWERVCYPARALPGLVRFLELHDTVSASEYFGVGPSQALMAACIFMQGVPQMQQEQEIGFSAEISGWLRLRRRERCFTNGAADYTAVQSSDPRALTFLRHGPDGAGVVAVNLTGEPMRCRLTWPPAVARRFPVAHHGFTGARLKTDGNAATVVIPPYRPYVALLKPTGAACRPIRVPSLRGARWTVRTSEGVLTDFDLDYAAAPRADETLADVLPTLGRARRATELGLMDGSIPAGVTGGPVRVAVSPWFVTMRNRTAEIVLARRHGGVVAQLARLDRGAPLPLIGCGGDAYTDQGLLPNRLFASADGETNPRLRWERRGDAVTVTFTGTLRQRAWNGVQQCAVAEPSVGYSLAYTMDAGPSLTVAMVITPATERTPEAAFFALRVPVAGFAGWERQASSGRAGDRRGVRLGADAPIEAPLTVQTANGDLIVTAGANAQRLFLIESALDSTHLFVAPLDGKAEPMGPGHPLRCSVSLEARPPGRGAQ